LRITNSKLMLVRNSLNGLMKNLYQVMN